MTPNMTVAELRLVLSQARRKLTLAEKKHEEFRTLVRDTAIDVASEQEWCVSGLNDTLRKLGLEQVPTGFSRTVMLKVTFAWDGKEEEEPQISNVELSTGYYDNSLEVTEYEVVEHLTGIEPVMSDG